MELFGQTSKNLQISNLTKMPPVGAELFHAKRRKDGQIDKWRR